MDQTMSTLMTKHTPIKNEIEANPWEVIPIKNHKEAKESTEIHLGGRNATILTNFHSFPNLQIVWINNNSLTSLKGLEKNFRIKHLFAQNNKIKSIDGILDILKHVETLVLFDNELRDLQKLIKNLRVLKGIKQLDLFQNPAAHEPNYKMRILNDLQSLEILDRHKISILQIDEAVKFMSQSKGKKPMKPFV